MTDWLGLLLLACWFALCVIAVDRGWTLLPDDIG